MMEIFFRGIYYMPCTSIIYNTCCGYSVLLVYALKRSHSGSKLSAFCNVLLVNVNHMKMLSVKQLLVHNININQYLSTLLLLLLILLLVAMCSLLLLWFNTITWKQSVEDLCCIEKAKVDTDTDISAGSGVFLISFFPTSTSKLKP